MRDGASIFRGIEAERIDEAAGSMVGQPHGLLDGHLRWVEPKKLVMLTDPDLIPCGQRLDCVGAHPIQSRTGDDGVLENVDDEQLVSEARVRQEDRLSVTERGQPVGVAITPGGRARHHTDAVHRDVSSADPENERETKRDQRWWDIPCRGVALKLQSIIRGDPGESEIDEGVVDGSNAHSRHVALSNQGVRLWRLRVVDWMAEEGKAIFRPRND